MTAITPMTDEELVIRALKKYFDLKQHRLFDLGEIGPSADSPVLTDERLRAVWDDVEAEEAAQRRRKRQLLRELFPVPEFVYRRSLRGWPE